MRAAHKEVNMKYKNVVELIGHWEHLMGKEAALNRLQSMRDYARQCLKAHSHEKYADALDDNMCLIEAVIAEAEELLQR